MSVDQLDLRTRLAVEELAKEHENRVMTIGPDYGVPFAELHDHRFLSDRKPLEYSAGDSVKERAFIGLANYFQLREELDTISVASLPRAEKQARLYQLRVELVGTEQKAYQDFHAYLESVDNKSGPRLITA